MGVSCQVVTWSPRRYTLQYCGAVRRAAGRACCCTLLQAEVAALQAAAPIQPPRLAPAHLNPACLGPAPVCCRALPLLQHRTITIDSPAAAALAKYMPPPAVEDLSKVGGRVWALGALCGVCWHSRREEEEQEAECLPRNGGAGHRWRGRGILQAGLVPSPRLAGCLGSRNSSAAAVASGRAMELWRSRPPAPCPACPTRTALCPAPPRPRPQVLRSPMPGTLVSLAVGEGAEVVEGQELAVVEAMKMRNVLRAAGPGRVLEVEAAPGDTLAADQVILRFE